MERVALPGGEPVRLRVPLVVEVGVGANWAALK
jgi:DNA polymerase I-like protein with 3'-5' exonuclease and polymerase domains